MGLTIYLEGSYVTFFAVEIVFSDAKIRSTHLLSILDLIIPPLLVTFFSATIDGRTLIFGHKLHIN
jgi:hypothetical protein